MLTPKPFYYVRHGETDHNRENRVQGKLDTPLNQTGITQALLARNTLLHAGIQTICHSPLQRAKKTAELFQEVLQCPLISIDALQEFDLGPHAGRIKGDWFYNWKEGHPLTGAEPYAQFLQRALTGINAALAHPGLIMIVAHGGIYRAVEFAIQQHSPPAGTMQPSRGKLSTGQFSETRAPPPDKPIPNCAPILHTPHTDGTWKVNLLKP